MAQTQPESTTEKELVEVDFIEIDMARLYLRDEIKYLRKLGRYRVCPGMTKNRSYERCQFYIGRKVSCIRFSGINLPAHAMQQLKNRMRSALPFSVTIYFKPFTRDMVFYLRGDKK